MARGDAADLFFRELRSAGLSRPAVKALVSRFEALESSPVPSSTVLGWSGFVYDSSTVGVVAADGSTIQGSAATAVPSSSQDWIADDGRILQSGNFVAQLVISASTAFTNPDAVVIVNGPFSVVDVLRIADLPLNKSRVFSDIAGIGAADLPSTPNWLIILPTDATGHLRITLGLMPLLLVGEPITPPGP